MAETFLLEPGFQFSAALDPHRRAAYERAIISASAELGGKPSIALLGWQAATLLDVAVSRSSRVVIIENNPDFFESVHHAITTRGYGESVTLLDEDPVTVQLKDRVDIVVFALHTPWFLETHAAETLKNAQKHVLKKNGVMIPRRFVHLFELASSPAEVGGMALRVPRYGRPGEPFPVLSESKHWATTDFTEVSELKPEVDDTIIVKPLLSGTLTGLRLSTLVELADNNVHLAGHSGYQSIFMPLREDIDVTAHQPVTIHTRFTMGEGLKRTRFIARHVNVSEPRPQEVDSAVIAAFQEQVAKMIARVDELGRGADLDKVVTYTFDPHGDVSRLTAVFWTVDDEFRKPLRDIVEGFRRNAVQAGSSPDDETIYNLMLKAYRRARGQES